MWYPLLLQSREAGWHFGMGQDGNRRNQVSVLPELVLMKDGEVQGKMIGLHDEDTLKHFISKLTEPTIEK
ncbi:hypothetical protein QTP88_027116 [Uroleucon formosanum]